MEISAALDEALGDGGTLGEGSPFVEDRNHQGRNPQDRNPQGTAVLPLATAWILKQCRKVMDDGQTYKHLFTDGAVWILGMAAAWLLTYFFAQLAICCRSRAMEASQTSFAEDSHEMSMFIPTRQRPRSRVTRPAFCSGTSALLMPQVLADALFEGAGAIETLERAVWCAPSIITVVVQEHEGSYLFCDLWLFASEKDALSTILRIGGDRQICVAPPLQVLRGLAVEDVKRLSSHWAAPPWAAASKVESSAAPNGNADPTAKADGASGHLRDPSSWLEQIEDERQRQRDHIKVGLWSERYRTDHVC